MKILLLGEYSNVHWTLAEGLRNRGHEVTVISNGDFWKDYPRDVSLVRRTGKLGGMAYMAKLYSLLPRLRDYDVVQLINPMFLEIKAERIFPIYRYLRRHNGKIFLGAFGMDYYWVHENISRRPLRYSDFNIGDQLRTDPEAMVPRQDWLGTAKERLNRYVANDCDGIITGLYEYDVCYRPNFPHKTTFIPFPIRCKVTRKHAPHDRVRVFIGYKEERAAYKGTDIMLRAAQDLAHKHTDLMEIRTAVGVPFHEYVKLMSECDIVLDQLYSYTPAMNALEAMSRGLVVVGGGEPENYEILGDGDLRPIVNVLPNYESVYDELEHLVLHPEIIETLKKQSIEYIARYHDYLKVAKKYEECYGMDTKI